MGRQFRAAIVLFAVSCLAGRSAYGAPINVFGSGVSVTNGIDNHYIITSGPTAAPVINGGGSAPAYLTTILGGNWIADNATASWISPNANANQLFGLYYTYQTTFNLAGLNATTAQLSGSLATDDSVLVYLNGIQVLSAMDWTTSTNLSINTNFVAGINTLSFVVSNSGGGPTGLDVALSGTANSVATPEPTAVGFIAVGSAGLALLRRKESFQR